MVGAALDAGITFFDTADIYGGTKSEDYLGAALGAGAMRSCWRPSSACPTRAIRGGARPPTSAPRLEDSLRRWAPTISISTNSMFPIPKTPIAETLGALAELVAEGKVREIGCSNFDGALLEEAGPPWPRAHPGFVSVQNQYNILFRDPREDGVLAECDRTGMAFLPYFPLATGSAERQVPAGPALAQGTRLQATWARPASHAA